MEHKEAIKILLEMIEKYSLDGQEKEAIMKAIAPLDSASLGTNRFRGILKNKKEKKERDLE